MTTTTTLSNNTPSANLAANGQKIITALGTGSGIDVQSLANNLVQAESAPQQALIQKKIDVSNASISGYGTLLSGVSALQSAFAALQDSSTISPATVQSTDTASFLATSMPGVEAATGFHQVHVTAVAKAQSEISTSFVDRTSIINGGAAFTLTITPLNGTAKTLNLAANSKASDVVSAINSSGTGVTASVVNTGGAQTPYKIVINSNVTGIAGGFSITDSSGALGLTNVTPAQDANLTVDGVSMSRSSNQITDAIKGVSLTLFAENSSPTVLQVTRDNSALNSNIANLVKTYNELQKTMKTLGDSQSSDPVNGGKLANDSMLRQVQSMVRNMVTGDSTAPGGKFKALRDIGVTLQVDGSLQTDSSKLQSALDNNLVDIVTMFTANLGSPTNSTATKRGIAGDAVKALTALSSPTGLIVNRENNRQKEILGYNDQMTKLQERMAALLDRYTKQFAAMDALVGNLNSQKSGLKTTFDNMSAMYSNK
mgnify:CR=1 FL=1